MPLRRTIPNRSPPPYPGTNGGVVVPSYSSPSHRMIASSSSNSLNVASTNQLLNGASPMIMENAHTAQNG